MLKTDVNQEEPLLRKDVSAESMWDREALYESWESWEADYELALAELPQLAAFESRLDEGPDVVLAWLAEYARQYDRLLKLFAYAGMATSVDSSDMEAKAHEGQLLSLWSEFDAVAAFAEPALTAMEEQLLQWSAEEPALGLYRHYFEDLVRMAPHRRSAEVEAVIALWQDSFYNVAYTARELTNTDLTFADAVDSRGNRHEVHQATLPPTGIRSPDREHRRTAWESFSDGYLSVQNTLASNYLTCVKQRVALARIRGHESVLAMMLAPSNLPVTVFHNALDTFKERLPVWHRYWEVRRDVLGVDSLRPYDIWAPLGETDPEIPYEEGVAWLCEGLAPLGEAYVDTVRRACLEERWVDYAPNVEKQQGAAAFSATPETPAFIYTGYEGSITSLSILTHELGHALHFYLAANNQPQVYREDSRLSMAVAETASNFHQAMLRASLHERRKEDRALRIALLDETLFNFHRYFFIMPLLAQFELEVYRRAEQKQPLTAPIFNQIMAGLFAEGYGNTMTDDPERTQITWAQFGHLYFPFYTFQYTVGIAAAHALAERVRGGDGDAGSRYLQFLKAGSSLSPVVLFELAGIDITTPEPFQKAFDALAYQIEQLAELAG